VSRDIGVLVILPKLEKEPLMVYVAVTLKRITIFFKAYRGLSSSNLANRTS
jgi:hypothetical protein